MSDIVETLRHIRSPFASLAAAELTSLRADLAAAQADAKSWKTVALSNQAASQSHQERWAKAEAELAEMTTERDAALEWAEKAERLERELASGSFYKEADIDRLMAERDAAQEREQRMREALERVEQWGRAYPLSVFPEPDFDKARKALEAAGLTLDAVSASNMRHVVESVSEIARAGLGEPQ